MVALNISKNVQTSQSKAYHRETREIPYGVEVKNFKTEKKKKELTAHKSIVIFL